MVGLAQVLFKYVFLPAFHVPSNLNLSDFIWLCVSVLCITVSGNIINDIHDIKTDSVNNRPRPLAQQKISLHKAYIFYFILNALALTLALYLSYTYHIWFFLQVELSVIILLFLYAKYLKTIPIIGSVLVSVLVSLSFLILVYVELFLSDLNSISPEVKYWIIGYGIFAFWANLNREWLKDVLDIKGDYAQGISTLPILLGKYRMNRLIFGSTLLFVVISIAGVKVYFQWNIVFILYITFGVYAPLFFVLYHIYKKELYVNYKWLSHLYKFVMLVGICSLILFSL
jgi:4-hydroxybenzoate polyprenyltransferase